MTQNKIAMRFHRPEEKTFRAHDQWKFEPQKRWAWLQKIAWKFLFKTAALSNGIDYKTTYKMVIIDQDTVSETILHAMREMQIGHIKPGRVYMGPDEVGQLAYECRDAPFSFSVEMGFNRTIFDLPVTVIPWMHGVLVVPKP